MLTLISRRVLPSVLAAIALLTPAPAQIIGGVDTYGQACGRIATQLVISQPKVGKDLEVWLIVHRQLNVPPGLVWLGIGFNSAKFPIQGSGHGECHLYTYPTYVLPIPFNVNWQVGKVTIIKNIPASMVGLKLYMQGVYSNYWGDQSWSQGYKVTIQK